MKTAYNIAAFGLSVAAISALVVDPTGTSTSMANGVGSAFTGIGNAITMAPV